MSEDYKFTISYINGNPGLVIKANTKDEIDEGIKDILPIFKGWKRAIDGGSEEKAKQEVQGTGLTAKCQTCGADMQMKTGFSKKSQKQWKGLFCPNAKQGEAGHDPVWL